MRHLANMISLSRIFFSILLLFFIGNRPVFFAIYLYCGLSDVLDGFVARKTHTQSVAGARLDSLADFVMFGVIVAVLFIWAEEALKTFYPLLIAVLLVRSMNVVIALRKYRVFVIGLHTWGNKLTGFLAYLSPILFLAWQPEKAILPIFIVAILSALEESAIHLSSKHLDLNRKSFFLR